MFDNGTLMPSYTDDVFRYLVNSGPPDYADGDVEAPTGWFGASKWTRAEFSHAVAITGSPRVGEAGVLDPEAYYAFRINSDGILWAFGYKPEIAPWDDEGPMADFDKAVDEYNAWAMEPEDDPLDERRSALQPRNFPHIH